MSDLSAPARPSPERLARLAYDGRMADTPPVVHSDPGISDEPDRPRVSAPDLPREIEPVGERDRPRVPAADDPGEAAAQLNTLTAEDVRDAEIARDRLDEIDSDPNTVVRGAELERRLAGLV